MLTAIWTKICALFGGNTVGVLFKILLQKVASKAASAIVDEIKNKENQQKAYELAKQLADTQLSNTEKAKAFNKMFGEWAKNVAKKTISDSIVNCLRELAVIALKAEKAE